MCGCGCMSVYVRVCVNYVLSVTLRNSYLILSQEKNGNWVVSFGDRLA